MYASTFDRLVGWLLFAVGITGLFTQGIGAYVALSPWDTGIYLALGLLGMAGARSRLRVATLTAMVIGVFLLLWGLWGLAWPVSVIGTAEPLETMVHVVGGLWGIYVSVHDVNQWRRRAA